MDDKIELARESVAECKKLILELLEEHACYLTGIEGGEVFIADYNDFYEEEI